MARSPHWLRQAIGEGRESGPRFMRRQHRTAPTDRACSIQFVPLIEDKDPYFAQDAGGQWWYYFPRTGKRARAVEQTCEECGKAYVARAWKIRGIKARYCTRTCSNRAVARRHRGEASPRWKGGRFVTNEGYVKVIDPRRGTSDQAYANGNMYVLEHRLVMETQLRRPLLRTETVHHVNGRRDDNRPENLELRVGAHGPGATGPHCATCSCFDC